MVRRPFFRWRDWPSLLQFFDRIDIPSLFVVSLTPVFLMQANCPFCSGSLLDDGRLRGQTVACPHCGGQFQMPGVLEPPPPPVVVEGVRTIDRVVAQSQRYRRRRPKSDPTRYIAVGITLLLVITTIVCFVVLSRSRHDPSTGTSPGNDTSGGEARRVVRMALDSWTFGDSFDEFRDSHPEIYASFPSWAASQDLQRYEITSSRYNSSLRMNQFTVILVFRTEAGSDVREKRTVSVEQEAAGWHLHVSAR